jgi:hypothetical protein
VFKEISSIMGIDNVDATTQGWFLHRVAATQNILSRMTDTQKEELRQEGEKMAAKGMPEELQRK